QHQPEADAPARAAPVHRGDPADGGASHLRQRRAAIGRAMVKLNKIYTRTGDAGTTGLVDGPRRRKDDPRVEAYGTVDETNAAIGVCRLHSRDMAKVDAALARIQNDLFDLGSDLATPGPDEERDHPALRITARQVEWLEAEIDLRNE